MGSVTDNLASVMNAVEQHVGDSSVSLSLRYFGGARALTFWNCDLYVEGSFETSAYLGDNERVEALLKRIKGLS